MTANEVTKQTLLFVLAGVLEIGGGYLVWLCARGEKQHNWLWGLFGAVLLVSYGWVQTLQTSTDFGRLYAAYGGYFIFLSLLWGWAVDGKRPDVGDWVGSGIAVGGVLIMLYWPRK